MDDRLSKVSRANLSFNFPLSRIRDNLSFRFEEKFRFVRGSKMIAFLFSRSNGVSARRRSIIIGAVSRVSCPEETRSPRHIKIGENVGARPSSAYFPARRGARFESRSHSRGRSRRSFRPKRGFLGSVSGGHRRPAGRRSKKNRPRSRVRT